MPVSNNEVDILIPERHHAVKQRRQKQPKKKSSKLPGIFMLLILLIIVLGGILSFANIGGDVILDYAAKYLSENYKIALKADNIVGNPVKGYTMNNFEISDETKGKKILSGGFLSGRMNFNALLSGKLRLAEIALGGLSLDIEQLIETAKNFKLPETPKANEKNFMTATPAFAAEIENENSMPDIPVDVISVVDSDFSSQYGVVHVNKVAADLKDFDIKIDGSVNGLALKGDIDMGENAGAYAINRSDLTLGSGKILATGGLLNDKLDFHASVEGLDLKEITALYPAMLKAEDFGGKANINVDMIGKLDAVNVRGNVDYKGSKIYGFPVERFSANFNYNNEKISLSNIQSNVLNIPVQGELSLAGDSVNIKIDGTEANLDGLDTILNLPELKALSGRVSSFSANVNGTTKNLNGLVVFEAPKIAYDGRALTNIKAQLKLANSDTANVDGKFNFEGANGYIQGKIKSVLLKPNFDVTVKLADLDIKRVENMIPDASDYKLSGRITAAVTVKGTMDNPSISGSLNSPEFSGFDQKITKPVVNFAFANKILTLSKTEGSLNGMPINLSGTVGPLPSANPNLNINATIAMSPEALKAYVPDIDSYALKGTVNAGVKIQGSVNSPAIKFLASSSNLEAMNMIKARDIELTTDINGDLAKLERIDLNASAKRITASGITVSNINASLNKNNDNITLKSFNAKSGAGTLTGTGTASVSGKTPLDFNFKFMNMALDSLASASGVDLKGNISGALKISGKNDNPSVSLTSNIPSLKAMGYALNNVTANLSGNMNNIKLDKVRAEFEGSEIIALGNVQLQPAMKFNVALNGSNINLSRLLEISSTDLQKDISGTMAFNFNVSGNDKNITGSGKLDSALITAYNMKLSDVQE